ncbi:MAG: hypothetical protein CEE38_01935 [Planctomycetes bacterium B3_Pla]|nr:MAG: hypothetical protein CEE38_01935 [Planctomycetes bacterium B3_Pla]
MLTFFTLDFARKAALFRRLGTSAATTLLVKGGLEFYVAVRTETQHGPVHRITEKKKTDKPGNIFSTYIFPG